MSPNIQHLSQLMERMTVQELRSISNVLQQRLEIATTTAAGSSSRLMSLPRELRDLIFHFAAFYHIRDIGIDQTPGLLLTSTSID